MNGTGHGRPADFMHDQTQMEEEDAYSLDGYKIVVTANDFNTKTLVDHMSRGNIILPDFQRNYVWTKSQASSLIESLLLKIPVPQIFLFEEECDGRPKQVVIDGQQRLMSIYFFVKGIFPKRGTMVQIRNRSLSEINADHDGFEEFRLRLLGNQTGQYNKKTYADVQNAFDVRTIRTMMVEQITPPDNNDAIYEIFNRLNKGGTNLNAQEIRRCVYSSKFYDMLDRINMKRAWRGMYGNSANVNRMADLETLLRSFALLSSKGEYRPPLKRFLNEFSEAAKKFTDSETSSLSNAFGLFLDNNRHLSHKDFCMTPSKFSAPLFESVFVTSCANNLDNPLKIDAESLARLREDKTFQRASSRNTTSLRNVQTRLRRARKLLTVRNDNTLVVLRQAKR